MGRLWKIMVAVTAVTAIAFSSAAGFALWRLWQHPPRLALERTANGLSWQGAHYAAMLTVKDAKVDRLMIWRRKGDLPPHWPE